MPDEEDYDIGFGFGYVNSRHTSFGIIQETEIFVDTDESVKITILRLKNTLSEKKKLKLIYYIKPVLGEDEIKTSGYIDLNFDRDKNTIFAKNIYGEEISKTVFLSSSQKITSYTGSSLSFIR